jgi:Cu/Ag efflux protein CusF
VRSKPLVVTCGLLLLLVSGVIAYLLLRPTQARTVRHELTGYVLEVSPEMSRITVRNTDIPGTMRSMVMDYRVKDATILRDIQAGDIIEATMVMDDAYWLENIRVTGKRGQ